MNRRAALLVAAALVAAVFVPYTSTADHVHGGPTDYVTMSDGVSIAVSVVKPHNFDATEKYPAILEMAGYENGAASPEGRTYLGETADHCREMGLPCPEPPLAGDSHEGTSAFRYDDDYVTVHAQVRGTGCSGGEFDLFSWRTGLDGKEIIDNWIAKQPWSNGKVGILGHSYSGNTGFMVAATRPQHLVAMTISGVIDDIYRGITYPGGVFNNLFPALWTLGIRPAYDVAGGTLQPLIRHLPDDIAAQCIQNVATHRRAVQDDPLLNGITDTDSQWFQSHSNYTYAHLINVPFHLTGAFQDEQTGPRHAHLWEMIPAGVPKRLLVTNGNHGTQVDAELVWKDRKAWMDYWMRGVADPFVDVVAKPVSVRALLELHQSPSGLVPNGIKDSTSFPMADTAWTPYFLGANGTLVPSLPSAEGSATYLSGTRRQSWFFDAGPQFGPPVTTKRGPDELDFISAPFAQNTLIAGPITANLFIDSTAIDTEFFVQVTDRDAQGNVSFLQRGLLRASHRAIDYAASDYFGSDPLDPSEPFLYRPWRPHTNPTNITPLETNEYLLEIFPVAHVLRPGHSLQIKIMAPPWIDSEYGYPPSRGTVPISLNTVHFGGSTPSRITLPVVSTGDLAMPLGPALACGDYWQVRCLPD
jgi:uncharacterized protein